MPPVVQSDIFPVAESMTCRSIPEQIADVLRDEIVAAEIAPDTPIKQSHIAKRFNVSQAPVREALGQLAAERLVLHYANRGVRVAPLIAAEVEETAALRILLECDLVRAAAAAFTAADGVLLRAAIDDVAAASGVLSHLHGNNAIHDAAFRPAGRPIALEMVQQLRARYARYLGFMWKHSTHAEASLREHMELLDLLQAGEGDAAADLLKRHIEASTKAILDCLAAQGIAGAGHHP